VLSLVVISQDERDRIEACLASVPFADEVLVIDSGSSDGTPELARSLGARVVETDWPGHVAQKNRGLDWATHDWVLSLDADERLSEQAQRSVRAALADPGGAAGFSLPRCSTWQGRPMRHGRWYPDRKVRLVRRSLARWAGVDPHDTLHVDGEVVRLAGDIEHDPYRSLDEHLRTIDRYTAIHARSLHDAGVRARRIDVWLRPPLHFVDAMVVRAGLLDGWRGVAVASLGARHTFLKWSRLRRMSE
jgi:glycosyltransferase involved in cell wall biosynthesis